MTTTVDRPTILDDAAFTDLWAHHGAIVRYMHGRVAAADAEDLADETFTRAWAGRATYRPSAGTPTAWLYGIARNVAADHHRSAGCRPQTVAGIATDLPDDVDVTEQVLGGLDAADARRILTDALAQLPERQRQVFAMRYLRDQSIADVAAAIDAPAGTVKSLASRAMAALRALLNPPPAPEPAVSPTPDTRSAHVATPAPARRTRWACLSRRAGGRPGLALVCGRTPSQPTVRGGTGITGNPAPRHRIRWADTRRAQPAPAETATPQRPHRLAADQRTSRSGAAPGAAGRLAARAAPATHRWGGVVIDFLATWAGWLIGVAFAFALAAGWLWIRQDPAGGRRYNTRAACDAMRDDNRQRLTDIGRLIVIARTPLDADATATGTATPGSPGVDLEHTVRLARHAWTQPIPQAVIDHVQLQQADRLQANNTGRHWRVEP